MNKMKKPTNSAVAAGITLSSAPSLTTTQLVQSEPQQSGLQPTISPESVVANLRKLSDALFAFQQCLSDVEQSIDSARSSIDSAMALMFIPPSLPIPEPEPEPKPEPEPSCESDPSEVENEYEDDVNDAEVAVTATVAAAPAAAVEEEDEEQEKDEKNEEDEVKSVPRSELETLCQTMNVVGLKNYMLTHLSDIDALREQVPKALKLSTNPGRLVLECVNKGREGCVNSSRGLVNLLVLECFLLMIGEAKDEGRVVKFNKRVRKEAKQAALEWRERMISQGGVAKALEMDARGLLLLIGCFGIPKEFLDRDVRHLVNGSGARGIAGVLRRSSDLVEKIPKIIEWMLKNNIVVGAVDIAYIFGMEDRFDPRGILSSFLHNSELSYLNSSKGLEQGGVVRAAKKKHLSDLKSVRECLERHNIDPSKLLPGWQIDVRIMNLEKHIAELNMHIGEKELTELTRHVGDQKMAQKRKIDETESSGSFSNKEMKPSHFPNPNPWPPLQQHRVVNHVVVDGGNNTLLERRGTAGHIYNCSLPPSVLHGTVAGSIHENAVGSMAGPVGGVVAVDGAGAGNHTPGQIRIHSSQLHGPRGDAAVHDRLASHTYAYTPSSYIEGSMALPNTIPSDAYRLVPFLEGATGLPNTRPVDCYRPTPYMEGSVGLPNTKAGDTYRPPPYSVSTGLPNTILVSTGLPNTIPAPYQFADTAPATELHQSSGARVVDTVPSAALAHPSSSMYWKR
ncbi:putative midasin-like [Capsicum annuum]|nr:putative midasin-like [Capsicum annuum]